MKLSLLDKRVLASLDFVAGRAVGHIADELFGFSRNKRATAATLRETLQRMAKWGLVCLLDNQKPLAWRITPAGRAALSGSEGGVDG